MAKRTNPSQAASATLTRLLTTLAQTGWAPESIISGDRQIFVKSTEEAIDIAVNEQNGYFYMASDPALGYRYVTFDITKGKDCITEFSMAVGDPFTATMQDFQEA